MVATPLQAALARAGMTPRELAHAVNERLVRLGRADRCIHPTAPYHWIRHGRYPYDPVPRLVLEVLRERTGARHRIGDLWPDHAETVVKLEEAGEGLSGPWTRQDTVEGLETLAALGAVERDRILPVGGVELVTVALDGARHAPDRVRAARSGEAVGPPMVDLIAEHTTALRRLDDRQGGARSVCATSPANSATSLT